MGRLYCTAWLNRPATKKLERILESGHKVLMLGSFKTDILDEKLNPECTIAEGCRNASRQICQIYSEKDFMTT